ncbi:hypothetical protein GGE67_006273 [Rhizobium leucaenae]|nr:hypothetical protein [Rhizobium leucaenae]
MALAGVDERRARSTIGEGGSSDRISPLWIGELVHLEDLVLDGATRNIPHRLTS